MQQRGARFASCVEARTGVKREVRVRVKVGERVKVKVRRGSRMWW